MEPDPDILNLARAERERRRRARFRAFPRFGDWLASASPEMTWDWAWQRYVQREVYDRIAAGELRKVMIWLPPRHGKSEMGTIRFPVYCMQRDPSQRFIIAAYGQRLAEKFSRKARKVAGAVGVPLSRGRNTGAEWETEAEGGIRAVGVGGSITGMGANGAFIDDPVKSRKEANSLVVRDTTWDWYCDDLYTRLEPGGWVVIQQTRWHEDDLSGRILESEDGPNWTVVKLPALAEAGDLLGRAVGDALCPERFDAAKLAELERILRTSFAALYQQRPTAKEGRLFKRAWFKFEDSIPSPLKVTARVRHWDLAATDGDGDWTCGVLMAKTADGRYWVEDVQRFRLGPTDRDARIRKTAEDDFARGRVGTRVSLEQEPGSAGKAQCHALARLLAGFTVSYETPTGSKEVRAEPYASQLGADNVRVCRDEPGHRWNAAYVSEHVEFPNSKHDDQVDGSSGAFNRLSEKRQSKSY